MEISNSSYSILLLQLFRKRSIPLLNVPNFHSRVEALYMLKYIGKKKNFPLLSFPSTSIPSMPPLLKSHSNILLADMTPYRHLIRCGTPHGMTKYLSTTTY